MGLGQEWHQIEQNIEDSSLVLDYGTTLKSDRRADNSTTDAPGKLQSLSITSNLHPQIRIFLRFDCKMS